MVKLILQVLMIIFDLLLPFSKKDVHVEMYTVQSLTAFSVPGMSGFICIKANLRHHFLSPENLSSFN